MKLLKINFFSEEEPACTFNATLYRDGTLDRCPTYIGALLNPFLKAGYAISALWILINILVAIYK